tara:strand:- start:47699 stop:47956 length:258 start_codon:yes stop_codon:yes gene_type:complete
MPSITIPKLPTIGGGLFITYFGTPNICTYWEVVEFLDPGESAGLGSFLHTILVTNADGLAVNQYVASTTVADAGKTERIKVSEGA